MGSESFCATWVSRVSLEYRRGPPKQSWQSVSRCGCLPRAVYHRAVTCRWGIKLVRRTASRSCESVRKRERRAEVREDEDVLGCRAVKGKAGRKWDGSGGTSMRRIRAGGGAMTMICRGPNGCFPGRAKCYMREVDGLARSINTSERHGDGGLETWYKVWSLGSGVDGYSGSRQPCLADQCDGSQDYSGQRRDAMSGAEPRLFIHMHHI